MFEWISSNIASIVVLLIVLVIIGAVAFKMVRDKKKENPLAAVVAAVVL